jgi:hypothetical protein
MVAKRRRSKKTTGVKLSAATLKKLREAHASLADLAEAIETAAGDPSLVRKGKGAKRRSAKRRSKKTR